jgi:hypothetical protein
VQDNGSRDQRTERNYQLGLEACASLARATWFAEYLARMFDQVRFEERERCIEIVSEHELLLAGHKAGLIRRMREVEP